MVAFFSQSYSIKVGDRLLSLICTAGYLRKAMRTYQLQRINRSFQQLPKAVGLMAVLCAYKGESKINVRWPILFCYL